MSSTPTIEELRQRIDSVEAEFGSRTNLLLDQMIVTGEKLDRLTDRVSRMDEQLEILADRVDYLATGQINLQSSVSQLTVLMTGFAHQAEADRAVMRSILEYLRNRYPGNGSAT